jgi:hypothetical protein
MSLMHLQHTGINIETELQYMLDRNDVPEDELLLAIQQYYQIPYQGLPEEVEEFFSHPLHIECKYQCRSSIISTCIELYPQALSKVHKWGYLPLHQLLSNGLNHSVYVVVTMIEKYPDALKHQTLYGELPLHLECRYHCRSSIILKCIDVYPEALAQTDCDGYLPLHWLLGNRVSSVEDALTMINKYPAALQHRSTFGHLPLHLECMIQGRSSVIAKCVEIYAEAMTISTNAGDFPWTIILRKVSYNNIYKMQKSLSVMLRSHPASFYHPPHDPLIDKLPLMQDPHCRRMILNLLPSCLSSASHRQAYHDQNWQSRYSLLHLWLKIRLRNRQMHSAASSMSLQPLLCMAAPLHEHSRKDESMRLLMLKLLKESSLLGLGIAAEGLSYGLDLGDGQGDLLLRFITTYM